MSYEQIIYNRLRHHGITQAGALGVLGNFYCESNCEPFRLQGDFSPYRTASKAYVQGVTNGSISRETFSKDSKGFGIYQLTYWTRKQGYYDFWKASGKALDSAELQTDYAVKEMQSDYPQLLAFLKQTTDIFTACSRVCREFERPAVNNIDARYAAAQKIKYQIDLDGGEDPEPQPAVDHSLRLRTIDKNCSGFDEVYLLTALLICRGYSPTGGLLVIESMWTDALGKAVKEFQSDYGLSADGIVGAKTWDALIKR